MLPLLRRSLDQKIKVFYQPMFKGGLIRNGEDLYENDYVRSHSMKSIENTGNIFETANGKINEYTETDFISLEPIPQYTIIELSIRNIINIYEWQNWLTEHQLPKLDLLSKEQKKLYKESANLGVIFNKKLIAHHRRML